MVKGQKVVCTNDSFTAVIRAIYKQLPVKGNTYTIREVFLGREKVVKGGDSATVVLVYSARSEVRDRLAAELGQVKLGDVRDLSNFMGAVSDAASVEKQKRAFEGARRAGGRAEVVIGAECDDRVGWFVQPTVSLAHDAAYETMCTELFGPVLTVHGYDERDVDGALAACANGSEYALTGAIFAQDRAAIAHATDALRFAAGNFYVNDKPTGAVVGQQPFGGSRGSGTNDKAGSIYNLQRWTSPRAIKETLVPPTDHQYPHMG